MGKRERAVKKSEDLVEGSNCQDVRKPPLYNLGFSVVGRARACLRVCVALRGQRISWPSLSRKADPTAGTHADLVS